MPIKSVRSVKTTEMMIFLFGARCVDVVGEPWIQEQYEIASERAMNVRSCDWSEGLVALVVLIVGIALGVSKDMEELIVYTRDPTSIPPGV